MGNLTFFNQIGSATLIQRTDHLSPVEQVEVFYLDLLDEVALVELQSVGGEDDHVHEDEDSVLGEAHPHYPIHYGHHAPEHRWGQQ